MAVICTFAVAVFLFLSNLGLCGPIGIVIRNVQLGLLGTVGYVFPVVLVIVVAFILSNRENPYASFKMTAALVALIFLAALLQLTLGGGAAFDGLRAYYQQAAETGLGGGMVGGALAQLLFSLTGKVGAMLILVVALFICLVYVTEKPLARMLAKGSLQAAGRAKEDLDRLAEEAKQRAEERRKYRMEQRARGVNLEATNLFAAKGALETEAQRHSGEEDAGSYAYGDAILAADQAMYAEADMQESDLAQQEDDQAWRRYENSDSAEEGAVGSAAAVEGGYVSAGVYDGADAVPTEEQTLNDYEEEQENPYSRFTGRILPEDYDYDADDSVPFDEEDIYIPADMLDASAEAEQEDRESILEDLGLEEMKLTPKEVAEDTVWEQLTSETVPAADEVKELHAQDRNMFGQEAGTRRVTTASGRVIESDMETLHKRIETRRAEAATEQDNAAVQAEIAKKQAQKRPYRYPSLQLLKRGGRQQGRDNEEIKETAVKLQTTLKSFGVGVTVTDVSVGPAVTRYELHPEQGVKVSRIVSLADDIKLSLAASDIRIEAPIPGKSAVGIEVPNKENNLVYLGDIIGSREFKEADSKLSFGVGKDIGGQTVVTDLAKMPHLLIAGATGSGKSVCINTLIMSLIYKASPEEVRLIMIDPKVVELQIYNGIPHLLIPVVTDPKKASAALNWGVTEMTDRYKKFAEIGVRDLKGYNRRVEEVRKDPSLPEEQKPEKLPQIVIIVDELADLMMVAPGEVEDAICRLAQLARAAGIHLVIATQRPSVNVITGLIKANVPSRVAFAVSSGVDSRTIIDMNGAEKLLGKGDMLFYPSGIPKPVRVQGAFVSDVEVQAVVDFLTEQGTAEYSEIVQNQMAQPQAGGDAGGNDKDELFRQAAVFIIESDKASIGMLQRKFRIGFNRAARIMDQLADAQVVGPEEGTKPRKILMTMEEFNEI